VCAPTAGSDVDVSPFVPTGGAGLPLAESPWHAVQPNPDVSTLPLMCRLGSAQVTVGGLPIVIDAITLPWQPSHAVDGLCGPPGGKVWHDVPHEAWLPSTTVQLGARFDVEPAMSGIKSAPWQYTLEHVVVAES